MKNKIHVHKTKHQNETTLDKTLKSTGAALLLTFAIAFALMLIGTAAALGTKDPTALVTPLGYFTLFATSFFGGFACSKMNKRAPYLTSALTGAGFVLLCAIISFALPHTSDSGMTLLHRLVLHLASFLTFPVGAFAGIKSASPKKRAKTRKRR